MKSALLTIILAALLGGGGVYAWMYFGGFTSEKGRAVTFINEFGDYTAIALEVENAVHIPGNEANNDRAQLEQLLSTILTDDLTTERREELARLAYNSLAVIKSEVDRAQTKQAELYKGLERIDVVSRSFRGTGLQKKSGQIVALARKRAELTAHITSVQSEANEQTYAIITKILQSHGELTQDHIQYINDTTAVAEERFADLTNLYEELRQKKSETDELFAEFVKNSL